LSAASSSAAGRLAFFFKGLAGIAVMTTALYALAGSLRYWQAAFFGAANALLFAALALGFGGRLGLIAERMKPAPNAKAWDKALMAAFMPLAGAVIVLAALDGGRFHWTGRLPAWVYPPAALVYCGAAAFHLWAILANEFYVSTVAVQADKGHRTVEAGPYRFVRHPGYTGIIAMELCIPLLLGSLWALAASGIVAALLLVRAGLEDAVLRRELAGYAGYAARVRYRVIPGIW
jgi:protein-S-isoprenylcysteine O-methyltransferase Ste14